MASILDFFTPGQPRQEILDARRQNEIKTFILQKQVEQELAARAEAQKIIEAQRRGSIQAEVIRRPSATFSPEGASGFQRVFPSGAPIGSPAREVPLDAPPEVKKRVEKSKLLRKGPTTPLQEAFKGSEANEARRQHIQQLFKSGDIKGGNKAIGEFLKEESQRLSPSAGPPTLLRLIEQEASDDPDISARATDKIKRFEEVRRRVGRQSVIKELQDRVAGDPAATKVVEDFVNLTAEKELAREKAKESDELSGEVRARTFDPSTFLTVPVGTTGADVDEKGFVTATPQQFDKLSATEGVREIIFPLKALADKFITAKTPGEAARQGVRLATTSFLKDNPQAATYNADVEAFLGRLSKALGGDTGQLSNQDLERMRRSFPSFRDTRKIKDFKFAILDFIVDGAILARKRAIVRLPGDGGFGLRKEKLLQALELTGDAVVSTEDFLAE